MSNWGIDPDVALFIGGPKDGRIENIRGHRTQRYPIAERLEFWTFGDPRPILQTNWRYSTYEPAKVAVYGQPYTVMVDLRETDRIEIERRVMDEIDLQRYGFGGIVTSIPQGSYTFTYDQLMQWANTWKSVGWITGDIEPDNRTDEEKLAWVTEGEGVDFL